MHPMVIVGSGMAGYTLARELRKRDAAVPLLVLTADNGDVYSKPMLSTALAQGQTPERLVQMTAAQLQAQLGISIRTMTRVESIDATAHTLYAGGELIAWSRLVLALGANPVDPHLAGDAADTVFSVNNLADYARFRAALPSGGRVVILGGGLIGCEFANDLAAAGHAVELVHPREWLLERLLPEQAGRAVQAALGGLGVQSHLGRKATAVQRADHGVTVVLDDGRRLQADIVLSAIGLRPATALAQQTGLAVLRGIVVDRWLRSSAADIYAIGDCAEVDGYVLPYVQPLLAQARALAAILCGGDAPLAYPVMPVVVKTPACPVVSLAAADGRALDWQVEQAEDGLRARQIDATGQMAGFVLTGAATRERQQFAAQLRPLLAPAS